MNNYDLHSDCQHSFCGHVVNMHVVEHLSNMFSNGDPYDIILT